MTQKNTGQEELTRMLDEEEATLAQEQAEWDKIQRWARADEMPEDYTPHALLWGFWTQEQRDKNENEIKQRFSKGKVIDINFSVPAPALPTITHHPFTPEEYYTQWAPTPARAAHFALLHLAALAAKDPGPAHFRVAEINLQGTPFADNTDARRDLAAALVDHLRKFSESINLRRLLWTVENQRFNIHTHDEGNHGTEEEGYRWYEEKKAELCEIEKKAYAVFEAEACREYNGMLWIDAAFGDYIKKLGPGRKKQGDKWNEKAVTRWATATAMAREDTQPPEADPAPARIRFWRGWFDSRVAEPHCAALEELAAALWPGIQSKYEEARRSIRNYTALDTSKAHHTMVATLARGTENEDHGGYMTLSMPGKQLRLMYPDSIQAALTVAFRDIMGPDALRDWLALYGMLTRQGRTGRMRWTLDDHMRELGVTPRQRKNPEVQRKHAKRAEAFTLAELGITDSTGTERERRPLYRVTAKYDTRTGSKWRLDGMEIEINPRLYDGVRDSTTGKLGTAWWPVPAALPRAKNTAALIMGTLLSIRFNWERSQPEMKLSGRAALEAANILYTPRRAAMVWRKIEKACADLVKLHVIDGWRWAGADDTHRTLDGVLVFVKPRTALEIATGKQKILEHHPAPVVLTGDDLRAWRKAHELTQAKMAEMLGRNVRTVMRAENAGKEPLQPKIAEALKALFAT